MKYVAILNNKKYEIQIEKIPDYQPLSREQITAQTDASVSKSVSVSKETPISSQVVNGYVKIVSPIQGSICCVQVAEGDVVNSGQVLLILEALKMENEIVAPINGTIASIHVKKGDIVNRNDILILIK